MGQKIGLRSGSELPAAAGGDSGSAAQWERRSIKALHYGREREEAIISQVRSEFFLVGVYFA